MCCLKINIYKKIYCLRQLLLNLTIFLTATALYLKIFEKNAREALDLLYFFFKS